nr:hypothetical protein [uncultured Cohaesibacter sp.]
MSFGANGDLIVDSLRNRFCYWQSENGNRYIFSQISLDDISSFENCVLLLASENEDKKHPELHWIGEISDLSPKSFCKIAPEKVDSLSVYVHLLAGSKHERQQVVRDLTRATGKELCYLCA